MHRTRYVVAAVTRFNTPIRRQYATGNALKRSASEPGTADSLYNTSPTPDPATRKDAEPGKKKRGRKPRQSPTANDLKTSDIEFNPADTTPAPSLKDADAPAKKKRGRKPKAPSSASAMSPVHILPGSPHHHDLASFLAHAHRESLDPTSNVYQGTHYEYTVAASLSRFQFALTRVGRASDRGIDLLGTWALPCLPRPLRVLVQCKAESPRPSMIRELEGAVVGAPPPWRADGVIALLAAANEATKGVRDAITRSQIPMGFLNVNTDGLLRQFVWNQAAVGIGLDGVAVTLRYSLHGHHEIALTWHGLPWPSST